MPRHASTTTPTRTLRLRRAFQMRAEPAGPVVAHMVADDDVDCASIDASSLAWRRRFGLESSN